jgi:hypothetical protein
VTQRIAPGEGHDLAPERSRHLITADGESDPEDHQSGNAWQRSQEYSAQAHARHDAIAPSRAPSIFHGRHSGVPGLLAAAMKTALLLRRQLQS